MRMDGRRPSARLDGVMFGAFEISRIIASTFLTISLCSDSSGSLIVGIVGDRPSLAQIGRSLRSAAPASMSGGTHYPSAPIRCRRRRSEEHTSELQSRGQL